MKRIINLIFFKEKPESEQRGLKALEEIEKQLYRVPYSQDKAAVEVAHDGFISIPSDRYIEVAKGVFDRVVESPKDIRFAFEKPWRRKLKSIDFDNYIVLFVKFKTGGLFDLHYHPVIEKIHCLKGSYIGTPKGHLFAAGDVQHIPAYVTHLFKPVDDGLAIVCLKKN